MNQNQSKMIVLTGLAIAMIFTATLFIKIPNAIDGYFNLGDGFILLFAMILPPFPAFLAGALGSALADAAGGYAYYFVGTFIIKGLEGYIVSKSIQKYGFAIKQYASIMAGAWMVLGYFLFKWYLKQNVLIALASIPGNIVQAISGIVIAMMCIQFIQKSSQTKIPL